MKEGQILLVDLNQRSSLDVDGMIEILVRRVGREDEGPFLGVARIFPKLGEHSVFHLQETLDFLGFGYKIFSKSTKHD